MWGSGFVFKGMWGSWFSKTPAKTPLVGFVHRVGLIVASEFKFGRERGERERREREKTGYEPLALHGVECGVHRVGLWWGLLILDEMLIFGLFRVGIWGFGSG